MKTLGSAGLGRHLDPVPYPAGTYRLTARFIRMPAKHWIGHITRFERDHLQDHYSA